jgi:hypothetical protein
MARARGVVISPENSGNASTTRSSRSISPSSMANPSAVAVNVLLSE